MSKIVLNRISNGYTPQAKTTQPKEDSDDIHVQYHTLCLSLYDQVRPGRGFLSLRKVRPASHLCDSTIDAYARAGNSLALPESSSLTSIRPNHTMSAARVFRAGNALRRLPTLNAPRLFHTSSNNLAIYDIKRCEICP